MKKHRWQILLAAALVALAAALYLLHFALFRDSHHIFIYLFSLAVRTNPLDPGASVVVT